MEVYDQQGRLIERKENISIGSLTKFGSEYGPGVYYLKVKQHGKEEQVKLVKLSY